MLKIISFNYLGDEDKMQELAKDKDTYTNLLFFMFKVQARES